MGHGSSQPEVQARVSAGVVAWREARLHLAGFDQETASTLASEEAVDLHALLDLIDRGCPPLVAARILAPLDDARRT
jgi:hypothetical protein